MTLDPNVVIVEQPKYLVRIWGRDEELVSALRKPDAVEDGLTVLCYWFMTPAERQAFLSAIPKEVFVVRSMVDPTDFDSDGNISDTRACTWAHIVLKLPDGRIGAFEQSFGFGYPRSSVRFMWEEGNYSCDCNKRLFLERECPELNLDPENEDLDNSFVICGDTIELVSLDIYHKHLGD